MAFFPLLMRPMPLVEVPTSHKDNLHRVLRLFVFRWRRMQKMLSQPPTGPRLCVQRYLIPLTAKNQCLGGSNPSLGPSLPFVSQLSVQIREGETLESPSISPIIRWYLQDLTMPKVQNGEDKTYHDREDSNVL